MRALRVAVFGAGAIGSFFGAALAKRADVVLIGRRPHMEAVARRGLRVEGLTRATVRLETSTSPEAAAGADLLVLTTKAYDTPGAARALRRAGVAAPVLSLQNGLTNIPVLLKALPRVPVLGGVTTQGVTFVGPGVIRHAGRGSTAVGTARGPAATALRVARLFSGARLNAHFERDLSSALWRKAVVNAAINPITAVLRVPNGQVLDRPDARVLSQVLALEAARVARAEGCRVPDPWAEAVRVMRASAANRSSMLQDIEAGRKTEIDSITGEIVRRALKRRIPAPANAAMLRLVEGL